MPGTVKDTKHLILHEPGTQLAEIGFSGAVNEVSLRRGTLVCSIQSGCIPLYALVCFQQYRRLHTKQAL